MRIFLVGFMGAGKSHLGKLWADKNQLTFFDLDELIEAEQKQKIAIIFEKKGEVYFREKEAATLRSTLQYQNAIIATGGGTPCFFNNMQWMLANGTVVFLNELIDKIIENINKGEQVRPLLLNLNNHEKQLFIANKLTERLPFYNQSNIILPSLDLNENGFLKIKNFIENKK